MNSLQNKMSLFEVTPPAGVWEKITSALDESSLENEFPTRLYNMELSPPPATWENINSSLQESEAPVIPLRKSISTFSRYAAAAVLIGVAAYGIIKWTNTRPATKSTEIVKMGSSKDTKNPAKTTTNAGSETEITSSQETPDRTERNHAMFAQLDPQVKTRTRKIPNPTITYPSNEYEEFFNNQYSNPIYAYEDVVPNMADRYIMLMTPEGNFIRMSKKLENLVCCVSGEEQDEDCKSQLKKWQQKMASSPLATSPGNFLDILTLVGSLDDGATEL
jgi:hypothetical protein